MTQPFRPIRGSARIELSDLIRFILVWHLKRFAIVLLILVAFIGFSFWRLFYELDVSPRDLESGTADLVIASLRDTLALMGGAIVGMLVLVVLLRVVVLPWFALWRAGTDRRTFTWIIDETGIRRIDGLGAESLLPWSNIVKVKPERRVFWLKVKPRGWRYLLRRAFSAEDQERLRELALRMAPN
ncbi:MAG TPA: YcxB family protein [Stellaceae bacterium]|nr:YcxB family protein [Stellaceae bacterium]